MTRIVRLAAAAGLLAAGIGPAVAQMERTESPYDPPSDRTYAPSSRGEVYQSMRTTPAERRQGSTTYVTGGVGKDESEAFRAMAPRYALSLEFARANASGDFLADVDVSVADERGQPVLETVADGPFLLANLPAGTYTVRAASDGSVKTQTVNVAPGGNRHLTFTW